MTTTTDKTPLLIDAVFGGQRRTSRASLRLVAVLAALALHAGLWLLAQLSGPSLETWSARIAALVHHDLNANAPTAIETIKLPEPALQPAAPAPAPAPAPPLRAATPPARAATPPARAAAPPALAQAAQIVAPDAPADLTADTFITGTASAYVGGAATSRGTSETPVTPTEASSATATGAEGTALAQAVSLPSEQWQCPWPSDALAQDLYEQFVIVRAWVRADGSVERANVISDPGYGFGAAAMACALRTRFNPARNARGEATRALSPPIRVRFTR